MGLFTTKIDLSVPQAVEYPNPVEIKGRLAWFCPDFMCPPFGEWRPYAGATVNILVDSVKETQVTTAADGSFSVTLNLPLGSHEVEAYYPGSWKDAPSQASAVVRVMSPDEYQSYRIQEAMTYFLIGLAVPVGIYAVVRAVRE